MYTTTLKDVRKRTYLRTAEKPKGIIMRRNKNIFADYTPIIPNTFTFTFS